MEISQLNAQISQLYMIRGTVPIYRFVTYINYPSSVLILIEQKHHMIGYSSWEAVI